MVPYTISISGKSNDSNVIIESKSAKIDYSEQQMI